MVNVEDMVHDKDKDMVRDLVKVKVMVKDRSKGALI